jgi:hypothetical protein
MVVTVVMDTGQRHERLVTSFAGVAVSATYGIFPLPQFDAIPPPDFGGVALPPLPDTGTATVAPEPVAPAGALNAAPAAASSGPAGVIQRALQAVVDGLQVLWEHPGLIPPLLAVWALLGAPVYVLQRRRQLAAVTARRRG